MAHESRFAAVCLAAVAVLLALPAAARSAEPAAPKPDGALHELDMTRIADEVGTGDADILRYVSQKLMWDGTPKPSYPVAGGAYHMGYYFTGPGKVLRETALRLYRPQQVGQVRSATRKAPPWTDKYWDGPADCSAVAWIVRDEKALTVRVHVTDEKFVSPDRKTYFNNDSVELYFDLRATDRGTFAYHPGVFEIILAPDKSGKVAIRFGDEKKQAFPGVTATGRLFKGGYRVTARIPSDALSKKHGRLDNEFNFSVSVNDSDTPGDRDTQMVWSGDHMNFMDARRFGRMSSVRRGYYFTKGDKPPAGALLVAKTSFHVRGKPLAKGGTWDGPKDCSAAAWLRRDAGGLTVHVDVTDDKVDTSSPQQWMRDRVALYFDFRKGDQLGKSHFDRGVMELTFPVPQAGGKVEVYSNGAQRRRTPIPGTRAT